ncbi:MAG: Gfo/Idh/MocA family protein, partial [Paracoccaceae bacterium]
PIESLIGDIQTIHATRLLANGSGRANVENEDTATAIVRFANGAQGSLSTSRSAWGRKNRLTWEAHGTTGMICFDQEQMNELRLYQNIGKTSEQGFKTILSGPEHPPFSAFCPAPGHQLGFNDLKIIEAAAFLRDIAGGPASSPDFSAALEFEKVIHAVVDSATTGLRVTI